MCDFSRLAFQAALVNYGLSSGTATQYGALAARVLLYAGLVRPVTRTSKMMRRLEASSGFATASPPMRNRLCRVTRYLGRWARETRSGGSYTMAEICAGVGTGTYAARKLTKTHGVRFRTAFVAEIGAHAKAVLTRRVGAENIGDITKMKRRDWRKLLLDHGALDFLLMTLPCQDLSKAGKQKGLDGQHSGLLRLLPIIAGTLRPRVILLENADTLAGRQRFLADFGWILRAAGAAGYDADVDILDAADFGAPQHRRRTFIVLVRRDAPEALHRAFAVGARSRNVAASRNLTTLTSANGGVPLAALSGIVSASFVATRGRFLACVRPGAFDPILEEAPGTARAVKLVEHGDILTERASAKGKPRDYRLPETVRRHLLGKATVEEMRDAPAIIIAGGLLGRKPGNYFTTAAWRDAETGIAPTMTTKTPPVIGFFDAVLDRYVVRRLSPDECEGLFGLPGSWTDVAYRRRRGDRRPPSLRDRWFALGNAVAVPVLAWLMGRVTKVLAAWDGQPVAAVSDSHPTVSTVSARNGSALAA